jgi:TolB-like protein
LEAGLVAPPERAAIPAIDRRTLRRRRTVRVASIALGGGVLALALALWGFPRNRNQPAAAAVVPRIAVLNLEASPPDSQLAVIGRAITSDLIDVLHRAPGLAPLAYAAVRALPVDASLDSLKSALRIARFVTGTIEARGDSVRVDVRIIDAETLVELNRHPLRAEFPRAMLLLLRDSVIARVGRELMGAFGVEHRHRQWLATTRSERAWELRRRAEDLIEHARGLPRNAGAVAQLAALATADSLLTLASAADPNWPEPFVARGWIRHQRLSYVDGQRTAALLAAEQLADSALARSASYPRALELRGTVRAIRWTNGPGGSPSLADSAESDLHAALRNDETLTRAWNSLSLLLDGRGDTAGANGAARKAAESDAYSLELSQTMTRRVFRELFDRRPDSARAVCARGRALMPASASMRTCELNVLSWYGRGDADITAARRELDWTERAGPFALRNGIWAPGRFGLAAILARSGQIASARAIADSTRAHLDSAGFFTDYRVNHAHALVAVGDHAAAIAILEVVVAANPAEREQIRRLPYFDALRENRRFQQLVGDPPQR